jgi:catechol 2,3-dioxygenase-like lactoylglutathione lyase family enzyme
MGNNDAIWSRRKLVGALAAAGTAGATGSAFAQGACRDGYAQGRCPLPMAQAIQPIPEVFAATGWKTTALESFTIDVVDYKKEAAFYAALMGWKLREDDGRQALMDVGNWGNCIFRAADAASFGPGAAGAPPPRSAVRSFAWVIDRWDARQVEAALRQRGMTPVAENKGAFQSFRVKDPDGWDLQICNNRGLSSLRKTPPAARQPAPPFAPTAWKTVWLDHFSFRVSNYKRSASFYANLLGWQRTYDEGSQNEMMAGDVGEVLIRGGNQFIPEQAAGPAGAVIDHVSFGITPWDVEAVRAALEARGLSARIDTSSAHVGADGKVIADDVYQAAFQSYHTETPNGFNLQISWNTIDKRLALANAVKPRALRKYP